MDDLNGLDWSTPSRTTASTTSGTGNYFPAIKPTLPRQTPEVTTSSSTQGSGPFKFRSTPSAAAKTAAPDSFSNLVSFGSTKHTTLTLEEQQNRLQAEKLKQEEDNRKQYEAQFGNEQFWDGWGHKDTGHSVTPATTTRDNTLGIHDLPTSYVRPISPPTANGSAVTGTGEDADLFAAFNSETKVDHSSYYPPPSLASSGISTPATATVKPPNLTLPKALVFSECLGVADLGDDDPFGLGQMQPITTAPAPIACFGDDDDFLGDLGKPVEELRRRPSSVTKQARPQPDLDQCLDDPWDKAVAELMEMGFPENQARQALTENGSGLDVQAAVGWILNDAHRQAKQKQHSKDISRNGSRSASSSKEHGLLRNTPAWMREQRGSSRSQTEEEQSSNSDVDLSKTATNVGNNFLKTANSLWKTSQKKVQKAVAEFQQDSAPDPNQPKWLREVIVKEQTVKRSTPEESRGRRLEALEVTDEALMLEGGGRPTSRETKASESRLGTTPISSLGNPRAPSKASDKVLQGPRWQQSASRDPRTRLTKQSSEEQSAEAYISPARRKKLVHHPTTAPETDVLSSAPLPSKTTPVLRDSQRVTNSKPPNQTSTRPKAPPRQVPSLSSISLKSSTQHRLEGTSQFKRGDYASAHHSYSSSLSALPSMHPISIILLCNRALTSLKTGVPKSAVNDADAAIELIGTSRGEGEDIDLGPGEGGGKKDMRKFYSMALMRKAEALEQMERWKEAGEVWKSCVEQGVGGPTAIQGRTRCEKALAPKSHATPRIIPKCPPKSATTDLRGEESVAVKRLREANEKAEKADDEKFALSDKVEARIGAWRDGKRDNLRALIGSLDGVMWEGSGWKKVGMHELVQNNKVKINYMKAIGKTHPDKLPQDANTEVRMVAALVFATLNESWDRFKQQNGM